MQINSNKYIIGMVCYLSITVQESGAQETNTVTMLFVLNAFGCKKTRSILKYEELSKQMYPPTGTDILTTF